MYQVKYKKLAVWMLPNRLRTNRVVALVMACIAPLVDLDNAFQRMMKEKLYRLSHNSQVCYLRAVLNDKFDNSQRRIYITDFEGREQIFFWPEADVRDVDLSVVQYFWPDSAYVDSGTDFTVHVPDGMVNNSDSEYAQFIALINEYKLPGKNYKVENF